MVSFPAPSISSNNGLSCLPSRLDSIARGERQSLVVPVAIHEAVEIAAVPGGGLIGQDANNCIPVHSRRAIIECSHNGQEEDHADRNEHNKKQDVHQATDNEEPLAGTVLVVERKMNRP